MAKFIKSHTENRSLTLYVIFSILVLLVYTTVELIISSQTSVSHDTLTTCFYACFGGEILMCGLIKIFKLKGEHGNGMVS